MNPAKHLHTIRFRILMVTISVIVLVSAIITVISYFVVSDNLRKNLIQTSETRLSFLCSSIDSNIGDVKSFAYSCKNSRQVRTFLMREASDNNREKLEAKSFISETYAANASLPSHIVRLVIIGNPGSDILQIVEPSYSAPFVTPEKIYSLPYYDALHSNMGDISAGICEDPFLANKKVQMMPFLMAIQYPYSADNVGYIFTEISLSVITKPIQNYSAETDGSLFFQIGDDQYSYIDQNLVSDSSQYKIVEDISNMALNHDTVIRKAADEETGNVYLILTRPLRTKGLYVSESYDEDFLQNEINRAFFLIMLLIVLAAVIIGIFLSWFLNRTINVPVKMLQKRMLRIADGDFSKDASTEWNHELGDIGKNINELSENVLALMNQRIEDERRKKDYEYKMLQSQINPHFLYNTLNSIKWMAAAQNASGIAEMTTALSRLLKNISKGTDTVVPLEQELSLIKDYFTIQQYRYGGTITLHIDMEDEAFLNCRIIKFTLQPIVENAIFHGIEPKGSAGTITIHIYRTDQNNIRIDVTDDGIGMPPDVACNLLTGDAPSKSSFFKEIGISNVHKRLQYEFGEEYGLSIQSEPQKYTTVSILLPYLQDNSI